MELTSMFFIMFLANITGVAICGLLYWLLREKK